MSPGFDDSSTPDVPRLGDGYVVGRDGPWVLLFTPQTGDLAWVDLEQASFFPFVDDED